MYNYLIIIGKIIQFDLIKWNININGILKFILMNYENVRRERIRDYGMFNFKWNFYLI